MKREEVIRAIREARDNRDSFLSLIKLHKGKGDPFNLVEFFQSLPRKQHEVVWAVACELTQGLVERLSQEDEGGLGESGSEVELLEAVVVLCESTLACDTPTTPAQLRDTLQLLHDILLNLSDQAPVVQNSISLLCERWWVGELEDREGLVPNCLLYVVARSLAEGATLSDVKRVWSMRQAFLLLDFEDISADSVKLMLLSALLNPLYLKCEEGRKFLSFLFGLHPRFVEDLHQTIRNQIPHCPRQFLDIYGEIYFRAWRLASGPYLKQIEEHCLQDLMYSAVHAPRQGLHSLFHALRRLLGYIHGQKNQRGISEMLLRLYTPFLWRSLKVANSDVRANAACLLLDSFPLQDPDSTREEIDQVMQKQFDLMVELLEDPSVAVRGATVVGVCQILSLYWEMIPGSVIKSLLGQMVQDLAWDASAISMRVAVLQGLCVVLENRLSHTLMKRLLPSLHMHLHDTSEKVRIAFLDLLLLVKGMRMIKFWHICSVEHLLARMEVDSVHVVKRIVALLIDSFQPSNISGSQQIERCIVLLRFNPGAARRFYQLAVSHLSPADAARFILTIHSAIMQCIDSGEEGEGEEREGKEGEENGGEEQDPAHDPTGIATGGWKEEGVSTASELRESMEAASDTSVEEKLTMEDGDLLLGLLEIMVVLWEGARESLAKPSNKAIRVKLVGKISESLPALFDAFKDGSSRSALYLLASYLPRKSVPAVIVSGALLSLSSLPYPTNSHDYTAIIMALVAWQQTSHVIELTNQWLAVGLNGKDGSTDVGKNATTQNKTKKGKKGRRASNGVTAIPTHPMLAVDILNWMMCHPVCFEELKKTKEFWHLPDLLKRSMDLLEEYLLVDVTTSDSAPSFELLSNALSLYIRLAMHKRSEDKGQQDFAEVITQIVTWSDRVLVPSLNDPPSSREPKGTRRSSRKRKVGQPHPPVTSDPRQSHARTLVGMLLEMMAEVVMLGLGAEETEFELAHLAGRIAETASGVVLLPPLCKLLYQMCEASGKCELEGIRSDGSLRSSGFLMDRLLVLLQKEVESNPDSFGKLWSKVKPCINEVVVMSVRLHSLSVTCHTLAVYASIVERCLQSQVSQLRQHPSGRVPHSADDLPSMVSGLVKQSCKNRQCVSLFASHLQSALTESEAKLPELFLVHQAALQLGSVLINGKHGDGELMRCVRATIHLLENLTEEDRQRWGEQVTEVDSLVTSLQERLLH